MFYFVIGNPGLRNFTSQPAQQKGTPNTASEASIIIIVERASARQAAEPDGIEREKKRIVERVNALNIVILGACQEFKALPFTGNVPVVI